MAADWTCLGFFCFFFQATTETVCQCGCCVYDIFFSRITWVCGVSFWNVTVYLQGLNFLSMQKRYQKNLNIFTIQADHNRKSEIRKQRVCMSSCSPRIFSNRSSQHAKTLHFSVKQMDLIRSNRGQRFLKDSMNQKQRGESLVFASSSRTHKLFSRLLRWNHDDTWLKGRSH